jgi:type II secretory pathway pseudopilin PulG
MRKKRMTSRRSGAPRRDGGFTLLEVIAAAGILGAGILAVAHIAVDATNLEQSIRETEVANAVLDREMQVIEASSFLSLRTLHDGRGFAASAEGRTLQAVPGDADGLPGSVAVTLPNPPNDASRLVDVTVTLDWRGHGGVRSMSRTLRISMVGAVR